MPQAPTHVLPGTSKLPPRLDVLLKDLRVMQQSRFLVRGAATQCKDGEDRMTHWLTGVYRGHILELLMCIDCEKVAVFNITETRLPTIGRTVNRPRDLWGWYTGARSLGRVHL